MPATRPSFVLCLATLTALTNGFMIVGGSLEAQEVTATVAADEEGPKNDKAKALFNGKTLEGWQVLDKYVFKKHGKIEVVEGEIRIEKGSPSAGIQWKGEVPRVDYELSLQAKRTEGSDFFCGLTFPIGKEYLTLIIGGWGGGAIGLSNLDGLAAVENNTCKFLEFENGKYYPIKLRVRADKVQVWIDGKEEISINPQDHKLSIWWEQEPCRPLGIATWYTSAAIKDIRLTQLPKAKVEKESSDESDNNGDG